MLPAFRGAMFRSNVLRLLLFSAAFAAAGAQTASAGSLFAFRRPGKVSTTKPPARAARSGADGYVWDEAPKANRPRFRASAKGKSVLWWNIEFGKLNGELPHRALDKNLQQIARDPSRPEVVALGEFRRDAIHEQTMAELRRVYPYETFVPYNDKTPHFGIQVFSTQIFDRVSTAPIDYVPTNASKKEAEQYRAEWRKNNSGEMYYPRQAIRLRLHDEKTGHEIDLMPLHTAEPWEQIKASHGGKLLGTLVTGLSVVFGRTNPLMNQLRRFRSVLHGNRSAPVVVFGDLNLVPRFGPLKTTPYRLVSDGMTDPFAADSTPTFPARSAPAYPFRLQLDRFLLSKDLEHDGAEVLPLQGSDHYPILLRGLRLAAGE